MRIDKNVIPMAPMSAELQFPRRAAVRATARTAIKIEPIAKT